MAHGQAVHGIERELSSCSCDQDECSRTLQLYIFETAPRALPPFVDELAQLPSEALARAARRAAWHPWRDAYFWRSMAQRTAAVAPRELAGRDLAQLCLSFRRIEFSSPELTSYCEKYLDERRQSLNTFELAAVLSYCAVAHTDTAASEDFTKKVADEVCSELRQQKEAVPWSAWRMLVSAAASARVPHQKLFEVASPHLARNARLMNGRDAVDICSAYALFRFKHHGLLTEVARFLPSMGLSDAEVWALQTAFTRLEFDAPLLERIRAVQSLSEK